MDKLDEDLDSIVRRMPNSHLSLQTTVNIGLELVKNNPSNRLIIVEQT